MAFAYRMMAGRHHTGEDNFGDICFAIQRKGGIASPQRSGRWRRLWSTSPSGTGLIWRIVLVWRWLSSGDVWIIGADQAIAWRPSVQGLQAAATKLRGIHGKMLALVLTGCSAAFAYAAVQPLKEQEQSEPDRQRHH